MNIHMSFLAAGLPWMILMLQGSAQEPDPGVPGDEGALRSQAFIALIPETAAAKAAEAAEPLSSSNPARGFSLLRAALREMRQAPDAGTQIALDATNPAGPRHFTDLSVVIRRHAAALGGAPLEMFLRESGAAVPDLEGAVTIEELLARAAAWPRTPAATAAYLRIADFCQERGDLAGSRSALLRILQSNHGVTADGGATPERATIRARERSLAFLIGDRSPAAIPPAELEQKIQIPGAPSTLAQYLQTINPDTPAAPAQGRTPVVTERWRVAVPPPLVRPGLPEPVERLVADAGELLILQTAAELLALDSRTGTIRSRHVLDASKFTKTEPTDPAAQQADQDRKLLFPGKRRARPVTDGRMVFAVAGGALFAFEKTPGGLVSAWSRGNGKLFTGALETTDTDPQGTYYCDGPLLTGGRLFISSIQLGADTSTSAHALDLATGRTHFRRMLAKGSTSGTRDSRRFEKRVEAVSPQPIIYCNGNIFIITELGTAHCLDALDGEFQYSVRIQRSAQPHGYEVSAPFAANGVIYAAPADSDFIYAFESTFASPVGGLPFAFDRAPQRRRNALFSKMAGATDTRAILYGREQQVRRTLTFFDFAIKTRGLDHLPMGAGEEPCGNLAMDGPHVFVPTNHGIIIYDSSRPARDLTQVPLPVDPSTRLPLRGDDALGDLSPVAGGLVSAGRSWIIAYDIR